MRGTSSVAVIGLAMLLAAPAVAASPLQFECSGDQKVVGRALVCEYFMLGRLNAELADLHDRVVRAGRAGRIELKRWIAARDSCRDVECLDQLYAAGLRQAKLALIDVESRKPAPIMVNARGDLLRVVDKPARAAAMPEGVKSAQEAPVHEHSGIAAYAALALLGVAITYAVLARRLTA